MPLRGERLRARRIELGLSQEELAEMIEAGQNQISRYENGKSAPDIRQLRAMALALRVSTDYLLGLTDVPNLEFTDAALTASERALLKAYRSGNCQQLLEIILGRLTHAR